MFPTHQENTVVRESLEIHISFGNIKSFCLKMKQTKTQPLLTHKKSNLSACVWRISNFLTTWCAHMVKINVIPFWLALPVPMVEVGSEACWMKKFPSVSWLPSQLYNVIFIWIQLKYYRFLTGLIIIPILRALGSGPDYRKYEKFVGQWIRMLLCVIKNLGLGLSSSKSMSAQTPTLGLCCLLEHRNSN